MSDTSKRNRLAGAKAYGRKGANLKTGRDYSYDKSYQKKPSVVKYQVELHRKQRELERKGKARVGDGKDISHKKARKDGGSLTNGYRLESASKNRARK